MKIVFKILFTHQSEKMFHHSFLKCLAVVLLLTGFARAAGQTLISRENGDYPGGTVPSICSTAPNDPGCKKIILAPYIPGERYLFRVPFNDPAKKAYTEFIFTPILDCEEGALVIDFDSLVIEANNPCLIEGDTIKFLVITTYINPPDPTATDNMTYLIPISRKPVKIAFVLDVSGSMGSLTTGGSESRIEVLKKAAYLFAYQLSAFSVPFDSCALTYFTNYLIQPTDDFENGFTSITPLDFDPPHNRFDSVIYRDMHPRAPLNTTAMGMGLIDGKDKLLAHNPADYTKIVFLFTDGLQNRPPYVNPDGITLSDGSVLNDFTGTPPHDTIHYFPVGICSVASLPAVLSAINSANSGNTLNSGECLQTSDAASAGFDEFFTFELPKALKNRSPQLVFLNSGTFAQQELTRSFSINKIVNKILICLRFSSGTGLSMRIEKDGKDITSLFNIQTGSYYQMAGVQKSGQLTLDGDYKVIVSGSPNSGYSLSCFADDHYLKYSCTTDRHIYKVGDPINISVKLKYTGTPLTDAANEITAVILKPGEDVGHLLAISTAEPDTALADLSSEAVLKHMALLNDAEYVKALTPSSNSVRLVHTGNGVYQGTFSGTELTGIYKIYFQMKGQIPGKGSFERADRVDAVLEFGEVSSAKTEVTVNKDPSSNITGVVLRPMNKYRKYIGPGFNTRVGLQVKTKNPGMKARWTKASLAEKTDISAGNKEIRITAVQDRLDGSYEIQTLVPAGQNPLVRLTVMDEVLRTRRLTDLHSKYPVSIWMLAVLAIVLLQIFKLFRGVSFAQKIPQPLTWLILCTMVALIILRYFGIILI